MNKYEEFSIGRNISIIYRSMNAYFMRKFAEYGIGSGQIPILMLVNEKEGLSQDDVAEELLIDKSCVSRGVERLLRSGYIRKETDPVDGRIQRLFFTPLAAERMPSIKKVLFNFTELLLEGEDRRSSANIKQVIGELSRKMVTLEKKGKRGE